MLPIQGEPSVHSLTPCLTSNCSATLKLSESLYVSVVDISHMLTRSGQDGAAASAS